MGHLVGRVRILQVCFILSICRLNNILKKQTELMEKNPWNSGSKCTRTTCPLRTTARGSSQTSRSQNLKVGVQRGVPSKVPCRVPTVPSGTRLLWAARSADSARPSGVHQNFTWTNAERNITANPRARTNLRKVYCETDRPRTFTSYYLCS